MNPFRPTLNRPQPHFLNLAGFHFFRTLLLIACRFDGSYADGPERRNRHGFFPHRIDCCCVPFFKKYKSRRRFALKIRPLTTAFGHIRPLARRRRSP